MTAPTCSPSSAFAPDIQAAQVVWKHWQSGQTLQALPESGARVPSAGNRMRVAEPEFAFTMAQDLTPQTAPYSLADNVCARHFVLGPAAPEGWRHTDLSQHVVQAQVAQSDSVRYSRTGSGAWVLGDPRIALTWLANQLSSLGITLQKGACGDHRHLHGATGTGARDTARAEFGVLGQVSMHFADKALNKGGPTITPGVLIHSRPND